MTKERNIFEILSVLDRGSRSMDKTLGISTGQSYIGIITVCGESLPAALEEKGIQTNTRTVESAVNFKELEPIAPVRGEVLLL